MSQVHVREPTAEHLIDCHVESGDELLWMVYRLSAPESLKYL